MINKTSREKWETEFYQTCVHPLLKDVQKNHQQTLDLIANDDSQGNSTEVSKPTIIILF